MSTKGKRHPLITKLMTIRIALGLTQQEVAEEGELNRNTVGTIESGKRVPSLDMFSRYCAGLGYRVEVVPVDAAEIELPLPKKRTDLYTLSEAAERLHISRSTLYTLIRQGYIDSVKNGRFRLFTEDHINAFIERNTKEGKPQ